MKKIIALVLLTISISSFASSYEEKDLAKCNDFTLVQVTIGSQDIKGNVSSRVKYEVKSEDGGAFADKIELNDLNVYQFVINDIGLSITESVEFNGKGSTKIFRMNGKECTDF